MNNNIDTNKHTHHHFDHDNTDNNNLNKDEKTLKILLDHWVEHNKSHEDNFNEWVEKCKLMNKEETAKYIVEAIEFMEKANEKLIEAKKHI
ncbi:hypothetical protein [Clostridium pasteurianum]|uniref:DUF8180 domain-containing protein n=1 Tax=Clostridium pasteurianum BC1 TaxID=86416 RepID=R4KBN3_CLOPA|nr:hypothetical protein [Clostridium pasteurianum]AGK97010.1 hypothetical protein Clopa_2131 [Clostridium pasteurianum BC1]